MLLLRELEQDAMLWQTPIIALTAQAFLLTIALAQGSTLFSRILAASLGLVVACLSMQLMAKHRMLEGIDRQMLAQLEGVLGIPRLSDRGWGWEGKNYILSTRGGPRMSAFRAAKSYVVWQSGIALFGASNMLIVILTIVAPSALVGH
ncbi:MAG TPA: hypothetical protein VFJ97_02540 [Dermatophilaceae bacterium]|nr:hypothetical protein [Dermatophilaceae bacterium]